MKSNRIMWGFVSLVVLATIAVTFGTLDGRSQEKTTNQATPTSTPDSKGYEDLSKYAVVEYDAPESSNAVEREERIQKNKRYDNQDFVGKNPHPETGGVGRFDEIPPPPAIPIAETD